MTGLVAQSVSLRRARETILDAVTLDTGAVGSIAIIGPNGAGKSSLLKLLAGVDSPTEGAVLLNGRPILGLDSTVRARSIGYMPQRFEPHWDLTPAELMRIRMERLPLRAAPLQLLEEAGLQHLADRRWSVLSGGERARVLLATVIAPDPPILLADEPGASLDVRHRLDVVRRLAERGRNRLVIVIMHDLDLAFRYFDRVVLIDDARLRLDGPRSEVFASPALDAAFGVSFRRTVNADGHFLWPRSDA